MTDKKIVPLREGSCAVRNCPNLIDVRQDGWGYFFLTGGRVTAENSDAVESVGMLCPAHKRRFGTLSNLQNNLAAFDPERMMPGDLNERIAKMAADLGISIDESLVLKEPQQ